MAQKEAAARDAASMPDLLAARLQRYAAQQRTRLMAARAAHRAVLEDGGGGGTRVGADAERVRGAQGGSLELAEGGG